MRPLVLAHRGACWKVPENTLEAFELAIAEEADYVEFDVRARSGRLVICHDPGPPEDVPTLDEVLAALTGRVGLCVEVKEEKTTDAVLDAVNALPRPVVFVLWGGPAQKKAKRIDAGRHTVLQAPHPSPLSAHTGFFGSRPFSRINAALKAQGQAPIDWTRRSP